MIRPWMPLYVADYLADTGHLTAAEHGGYLLLIMHYWSNGALPADDRKLARIARMTPDEWDEARETIAEFFDEGWRHKRIDAEIAKSEEKSEAARASASKRWQSKGTSGRNADAMRTHSEGNADADASAMLSQPQSHISSSSLRSEDEPRAKRASVAQKAAEGFERFWQAWPNQVAKRDAAKAFLKVAGELDAILAGIERYIAAKPPDRDWMHPATFLNGRRWEDAHPPPVARAGPTPNGSTGGGFAQMAVYARMMDDEQAASSNSDVQRLPSYGKV